MSNNNSGVLYIGLNDYGITYFYLLTNITISVIGLVALFLNFNVIYILIRKPRHWDAGYLFLGNLALSDILLATFTIYDVIYNLIHYQHFYECLFRFGLLTGIIIYSNMSLLALSLDRYVKILSPYFYIRFFHNVRFAKVYLGFTMLVFGIIGLLPLFGWNRNKPSNYCGFYGVLTRDYLFLILVLYFTTILLIYLMNVHILLIAFSQVPEILKFKRFRRSSSVNENCMVLPSPASLWWVPTKTVLIIVGVNVLCTMPVGIYNILVLSGHLDYLSDSKKGKLLAFVAPSLLLNCIANPVIYALKIPDIGKELKQNPLYRHVSSLCVPKDLQETCIAMENV